MVNGAMGRGGGCAAAAVAACAVFFDVVVVVATIDMDVVVVKVTGRGATKADTGAIRQSNARENDRIIMLFVGMYGQARNER